jgi:hypothetical protein
MVALTVSACYTIAAATSYRFGVAWSMRASRRGSVEAWIHSIVGKYSRMALLWYALIELHTIEKSAGRVEKCFLSGAGAAINICNRRLDIA